MKVLEVPTAVGVKRMLIATDFSPSSERALRHGLSIARRYNATVYLVHVVDSLGYRLTGADASTQAVELATRDLQQMERQLITGGLLKDLPHQVLVESGSGEVWKVVCRLVRQHRIELVVLGTHGRTGIKKLFLGSVAEDVFRHAPCPVLTVGPAVESRVTADVPPRTILFPTDFSPESLQALPLAVSAANECSAELTLLHVLLEVTGEAASDRDRVFEAVRSRLRELVKDADLAQPPRFEVAEGNPPEVVLDTASARQSDLIIMGLRSPDAYAERLVWQYAYDIVRNAPCPVLTVRSAAQGKAAGTSS